MELGKKKMSKEAEYIKQKLKEKIKPEKVFFLKRILNTPYRVLGVMVPDSREIAREFKNLDIYSAYNLFDELWNSDIHEEKSVAIHILQQYKKKFSIETWKFLKSRLDKAKSWDHIDWLATDVFAEILKNNLGLMGEIKELSESKNFWERRLAIESTIKLIRQNKLELVFRLAEKLVYDDNEYVQKGAGWMLREAGKRNRVAVREFILMHLDMKNTAFSYATEKMKELREIRKEKIGDVGRVIKKFTKLENDEIKRILEKLEISYEGSIQNVDKEAVFNKITEMKKIKEINEAMKK